MKILYVHMAALGDGLMASPALALLKERLPGCEVHVLARSHVVRYFRSLSAVDEVLPFADQRWLDRKRLHLLPGALPGFLALLARLRRERYDACLQWRGQCVDSFLSCWSGAPVRIAAVHEFHRKSPLPVERTPWLMTDLVTIANDHAHVIDAMAAPAFRLIERVTGQAVGDADLRMSLPTTDAERTGAAAFLARNGLEAGRFACVSFSSKTDANTWPVERFAAVADHLAEAHGLRVVLDGLPMHRDREAAIAAAMRTEPVRSAGELNLGEIAHVIAAARLVVSFNSAPMHLASTFGTPAVVIGGRDGAATRPWRVPHEVVQHNPHFPKRHPVRSEWPRLIGLVQANEVTAAIDRVLAAAPPRTAA